MSKTGQTKKLLNLLNKSICCDGLCPKLSEQAGNSLICLPDGLYSSASAVSISDDSDNCLELREDGLYIQCPSLNVSANNGLTENTPNNFQLGGTLIKNTDINTGSFYLNLTGNNVSTPVFQVLNFGGGGGSINRPGTADFEIIITYIPYI